MELYIIVVFNAGDWPTQDKVPDISELFFFSSGFGMLNVLADSPEVQEWLTELDGFYIPDWSPTTDGSCADDPTAAAQAAERGWWTCGGHTRPTGKLFCFFFPQVHDVNVLFG
jgi:hypothetical protein